MPSIHIDDCSKLISTKQFKRYMEITKGPSVLLFKQIFAYERTGIWHNFEGHLETSLLCVYRDRKELKPKSHPRCFTV